MSNDRYLTFALGKGRLASKTLELLEQIGITCEEMKDKDSRKLIFVNEDLKLRFFLAKGPMFPLTWNTALPISVWSEVIPSWRRTEEFMRFLIWALANAGCVCAVPNRQESS